MEKSALDNPKDKKTPGVAETGVLIRKTSIRRRISKDDSADDKPYGIKHDEYEKICERVMADNGVQKTLEAMREKWQMIMFMYDDCMDLIKENAKQAKIAKRNKLKREFIALVITYLLITLPAAVTVYLASLFVIWFVTTAG